ncbi:Hypothetical predicted protein [Pelobates cultripes]|uniref:Uncharacterized protein n=1 Tax=Pelobates cultripes TaxID=61616 RepID=A0AAD1VNM2_PELCU|nr:Hypothetical predicted protein [Pelobates cultripes]
MLLLDRSHRIPKPRFLTIGTARQRPNLPNQYQGTAIYADISAATLKSMKSYSGITEQLRFHKKPYRWGFLVKLLVMHEGKTTAITSPEAGLQALKASTNDHKPHSTPRQTHTLQRNTSRLQDVASKAIKTLGLNSQLGGSSQIPTLNPQMATMHQRNPGHSQNCHP